jgi:hypothetical protein
MNVDKDNFEQALAEVVPVLSPLQILCSPALPCVFLFPLLALVCVLFSVSR